MSKPGKLLRYDDRIRKRVRSGEKVPLKLSARERELILEHTFADDELTLLRIAAASNKGVRLLLHAG